MISDSVRQRSREAQNLCRAFILWSGCASHVPDVDLHDPVRHGAEILQENGCYASVGGGKPLEKKLEHQNCLLQRHSLRAYSHGKCDTIRGSLLLATAPDHMWKRGTTSTCRYTKAVANSGAGIQLQQASSLIQCTPSRSHCPHQYLQLHALDANEFSSAMTTDSSATFLI